MALSNRNKSEYLRQSAFAIDKALLITYLCSLTLSQYLSLFFLYLNTLTASIFNKPHFLTILFLFWEDKEARLSWSKGSKKSKVIIAWLCLLDCKNISLF